MGHSDELMACPGSWGLVGKEQTCVGVVRTSGGHSWLEGR
jgi:hypothetical protein